MKTIKYTAAILAIGIILGLSGNTAAGWTLADCEKVNFNHPDCLKYLPTPHPAVFPTAKPTEKPEKDDAKPTATPVGKPSTGPTPQDTRKPAVTVPAVKSLPSTSTE